MHGLEGGYRIPRPLVSRSVGLWIGRLVRRRLGLKERWYRISSSRTQSGLRSSGREADLHILVYKENNKKE